MKSKEYKELYVLVFKETGIILTPDSFHEYWKNYGSSGGNLYGWRPPKKIYYTLGMAKRGFSYIPDDLKPKITISKFIRGEDVIDGQELKDIQVELKKKKKIAREISDAKRQKQIAERELQIAQARLEAWRNVNKK